MKHLHDEMPHETDDPADVFNEFDFIMAYEGGTCTDDEIITGFQRLVDSGTAWRLQGSYGRMAHKLIDGGYIHA